jgi:hypothetical protein
MALSGPVIVKQNNVILSMHGSWNVNPRTDETVRAVPKFVGKIMGGLKFTVAGEVLADRIKRERRLRRFCRRPHVFRADGHAWCGLPSEHVEHMCFRSDVPPSAGFCAHCRAAYRRRHNRRNYGQE